MSYRALAGRGSGLGCGIGIVGQGPSDRIAEYQHLSSGPHPEWPEQGLHRAAGGVRHRRVADAGHPVRCGIKSAPGKRCLPVHTDKSPASEAMAFAAFGTAGSKKSEPMDVCEPPRVSWRLQALGPASGRAGFERSSDFVLGGRDATNSGVEPPGVVPVDVAGGCQPRLDKPSELARSRHGPRRCTSVARR
jgi:hypothetical protein